MKLDLVCKESYKNVRLIYVIFKQPSTPPSFFAKMSRSLTIYEYVKR